MYPTLVIVLVATRFAFLERSIHSASSSGDVRLTLPQSEPRRQDSSLFSRYPSRRWSEDIHQQNIAQRLEVSFGPSLELRSMAMARKDEEEDLSEMVEQGSSHE